MNKICPKCYEDMIFEDDSFDYGESHCGSAGTEIIQYWSCKCGNTEDYEGDDYE